MTEHKIAKNLVFDLITELNLKASQDLLISEIDALLKKHPDLCKCLNKSKEAFTRTDLQKLISYLSADKRIDKKAFKKSFFEKVTSFSREQFAKAMVYDCILLSFYMFFSLIINLMYLNKCTKRLDEIALDADQAILDFFDKKKHAFGKSKFNNN